MIGCQENKSFFYYMVEKKSVFLCTCNTRSENTKNMISKKWHSMDSGFVAQCVPLRFHISPTTDMSDSVHLPPFTEPLFCSWLASFVMFFFFQYSLIFLTHMLHSFSEISSRPTPFLNNWVPQSAVSWLFPKIIDKVEEDPDLPNIFVPSFFTSLPWISPEVSSLLLFSMKLPFDHISLT